MTTISIPNTVTTIGRQAFENCSRLYSIEIGRGLKTVKAHAFDNCSGLTEVKISDLASWCKVDFIFASDSPVSYAHHLFLDGNEIRDLTIPDEIVFIKRGIFTGCSGLRSLTIPNQVTSIDRESFKGCSNLTTINFGNGVQTIGDLAFYGCSSLEDISFPNSLRTIGVWAFWQCSLRTIEFGEGVESIGDLAFRENLVTELRLPDSLTGIGKESFARLSKLSNVRLGKNLTTIGDSSFANDKLITSLYVPISVSGIGDDAFIRCNALSVIYLPEALQGRESSYGLPSGCRIVWHNGSFDLDVASAMGEPVPVVGTTEFEPGQTVSCAVQKTIPDPDRENVSYECTGWTGTGSVPSVGTGTNVSFVIEMNSSIAWNWRTNVNVFGDGKPLEWTDSGDAGWTAALGGSDTGHEDCLRSGAVSQGQTSVRETTVVGPGTLSFDWKISANRADFGRFLVDGATNASITKATSWATVTQTIPSGTHTLRWVYERNSTTPAGDDGLFLDNVIWRPVLSLAVSSSYGTAVPAAGTTQYGYNDQVSARVASPAAANGTRRVCTGWTGTGSVPASGTATNVAFRITENSTLRWNWRTDYWIELSKSGNVSPDFASAWVKQGNTVTVTWPDPGASTVVRVSGDTDGTTFDEAGRTLVIPADRPRSLSLAATTLTLADALDETKPVWSTGAVAPWTPQGSVTKDGEDAAISAAIGGGAVSALEAAVEGPGTFAWSWKLDRGDLTGIDVFVDGTFVESLSTVGAWSAASAVVSGTGTHVVRFEYWNESGSTANRGYLDCVSWSGGSTTNRVLYVDATTGNNANGGLSPATAFKTIQAAVAMAVDGDEIVVAAGVYKETDSATCGLSNERGINVLIRSADGPLVTAIDGDGARRVIKGTASSTQNSWKSHVLTLDGFTIRNGFSSGVGIAAYCVFRNCIVTGNTAGMAAGLDFCRLENCLVFGNVADAATSSGTTKLFDRTEAVNCTVTENGIANTTGSSLFSRSTVINSVIYGNTVGVGTLFDGDTTVSFSCAETMVSGTGNIAAEPRFVDAANGDFRLAEDSPCIDTGAAGYLDLSFDLDGNPRVKGRSIDMGCYEFQTVQTETTTTPVPVPFAWLDKYPETLAANGGDYETFGNATAANDANKVWECYVAGLNPTNAAERFLAHIAVTNGTADVWWTPDLNEGGTKSERVYTIEGKTNLGDQFWGPTNESTRFFRVKVEMP